MFGGGRKRSKSRHRSASTDSGARGVVLGGRRRKGKGEEEQCSDEEITEDCTHSDSIFVAARFNDLDRIIHLFYKGVNVVQTDEQGNTPLHIAAMNGHRLICRALIVLAAPKALWQMQNKEGMTPEELTADENCKADLHAFSHTVDYLHDMNIMHNQRIIDNTREWKKGAKVLFSLDGGGIRSLITCQILVHLDRLLEGTLMQRVDWVAGTSCGGLLALLLCTNERKLEEVRRFIFQYKDRVFCGNNMKVPKHNARGLEYVAQNATGWGDAKMDTIKKHKLIVTVADTRQTPSQLVLFRSFAPRMPDSIRKQSEFLDPDKLPLWQAARCTSAAPYFFESFNGFSDGGLVANNPTLILMTDFFQTLKLERDYIEDKDEMIDETIGCVLSVGTGRFPSEATDGIDVSIHPIKNPMKAAKSFLRAIANAKNLFVLLIKECTTSNGQPVKYAREWCHSIGAPYFRFSPHLPSALNLDETDNAKIIDMMWETELYVFTKIYNELRLLAKYLQLKPLPAKKDEDSMKATATASVSPLSVADREIKQHEDNVSISSPAPSSDHPEA